MKTPDLSPRGQAELKLRASLALEIAGRVDQILASLQAEGVEVSSHRAKIAEGVEDLARCLDRLASAGPPLLEALAEEGLYPNE